MNCVFEINRKSNFKKQTAVEVMVSSDGVFEVIDRYFADLLPN